MSPNNFDLIRLFAALQVAALHMMTHLGLYPAAASILSIIPGVPVFFFVSGFLISRNYERSPSGYLRNRFLRIAPALWLSVLISLALIFTLFGWSPILLPWALAQGTILQAWNPEFLNGFGIGVANGALWTIAVEIGFYAMVPIVYRAARIDCAILIVSALSLVVFLLLGPVTGTIRKAAFITSIPWFWMFGTGMLAQRQFAHLRPLVEGRFLYWCAGLALVIVVGDAAECPQLFAIGRNEVGVIVFIALAGTTLAAAYSAPTLAGRLLHRQDVSYGIYVYHMPVVNTLIVLGVHSFALALVSTVGAALLSWFLVERRVLFFKHAMISPAR
ncbi:MAG: acyltransferase [Sphingomonadaceae bacterium]|nr:acyltransferase [Sphingomonadaceae bacterium]